MVAKSRPEQREGERMRMPSLHPDAGTLRQWKAEVFINANALSNRSDHSVIFWLKLADDTANVSDEDLAHVPSALVTLDRKLAAGIVASFTGEFHISITRESERLLQAEGR